MKDLREIDLMTKAKGLLEDGKLPSAQTLFAEIIDNNAANSEAFFHLANIFHMNGEIGKAIKAFNKVLELEPSHTDASISLSVLYNDIGRYEEAKQIFSKANERVKNRKNSTQDVHVNRKFSLKHYELADLYITYNRYEEALFEYNKAIDLDPENLDARVKLSKVYAKQGYAMKAHEELVKLKNEQPSYLPARIALGVLYYGSGKVIEAQGEWNKVLSKDPSNAEANMYMNLSQTATETRL